MILLLLLAFMGKKGARKSPPFLFVATQHAAHGHFAYSSANADSEGREKSEKIVDSECEVE
jgi:hypothetical protein